MLTLFVKLNKILTTMNVLEPKIHINHNMYSISELVAKFGIGLGLIFAPIHEIVGAIVVLILIDFATGIWAVYKQEGRNAITSRKMSFSVSKILLYTLTIISAKVCETYLTPEIPIVKITTYFIGMTEIKSIYENVGKILKMDIYQALRQYLQRTKDGNP
jgi:phage-related holin